MVVTEKIKINDIEYTRNYSDIGMYIERDGVRYSDAIDPVDTDRKYTETDEPIPKLDIDVHSTEGWTEIDAPEEEES